jgi:hypothetical protein
MSNWTHCTMESHRGMEFLCDFCNKLLDYPNIYYLRSNKNDIQPSHACCYKCMEAF